MRKNYLLVLLAIMFTMNGMAQNIPYYVPKDGLVAWWPFNGNTNDESGNARNLTNNGASLEADRHGNKNKAYLLANGSNLSYTGKSITGGESYTYSFWMKTNKNLNEYQDFIFRENGTNETGHETGVWFFFEPSSKDFGIVNPGNSYAGILRKQFPYTNEWHHVVVQGPREYKVYVDGKLVVTGSSDYKKFADTCTFQIGTFQGSIDDFSVHNRQLSLDEIKAMYSNSATKIEIPTYLPQDGLVAWWPFNGNTYDESGNSRNLTNNGAELEADRYGNANKAYLLSNGSNLRYRGKSITGGESFTYSFWMKTNKYVNEYQDFIFRENGVNETGHETGVWFFFHPSTKDFGIVNPGNSYAGILRKQFPYIDEWHHVVVQGPNEYKIYVDGKLFETSYSDYKKFADTCTFQIGTFQGSIDDFSVHNRKLSLDEIQALFTNSAPKIELPKYIPTDGLVGYWPFNGNANDESGNGNDGIENKINYVVDRNGKINSAINFNQDKLSKVLIEGGVKNSKGLIKTISVWFNMPKIYPKENYYNILVSAKGPIWKYDPTSYQKEGDCMININGDLEPYPSLGYVNKISVQAEKPGNQSLVNDAVWHHLIVEVNCIDNKIKEFFDGKLVQEYKLNYYPTSISDWDILSFGNNARHCPECVFSGNLDDITIYNRALSEQEITSLYRSCSHEQASSDAHNSILFTTGSPIDLAATPAGGTFTSAAIKDGKFTPSDAKIGLNKIQYTYKNSQGCDDITEFQVIVSDTSGTKCTKIDTVTITNKVTKYDTVIVKNTIYDTILKLKFKLTTGIKANQLASMSLYPNPTKDLLHIEVGDAKALEGYRYRIVDALGKEVYNELVKNAITEIPMNSLGASGMYQFEVLDQKNTRIQANKIVLE